MNTRDTLPAGMTLRPPLVDSGASTVPVEAWATWEDYCRAIGVNPKLARLVDLTKWEM